MKFLHCAVYLAAIGIFSFFAGSALPRRWFHADNAFFQSKEWEKQGGVYVGFGIKKWKDKVPDMSRIIPIIAQKRLTTETTTESIDRLIQETCVAETTHWLLIIAGFASLLIWPGPGGIFVAVLWTVPGNLSFIMIQRYNRPRLKKLRADVNAFHKTGTAERNPRHENYDFDLQYGRRT